MIYESFNGVATHLIDFVIVNTYLLEMTRSKIKSKKAKERKPGQKPESITAPPSPSSAPKKKAIVKITGFTIIILFPFVLLALIEGVLRLSGYGFCPDVVVPCEINGEKVFHTNSKFAWRFFPPRIAREFPSFTFPDKKGSSTYRIFVVGESAAMGEPEPAFSFWRILEIMLSARYPEVKFEIIPVAMTAVNSHVCREIVHECARYRPDLFIIYMGNNEVVGPYGPGTVITPVFGNLLLIRTAIALRSTRTGQLLTNILSSFQKSNRPKSWEGLEMFLNNPVRAGDPRLQAVYHNFRENLKVMRHDALRSGAEVMLCTVGCNLMDNPPFESLHRPNMSGDELGLWEDFYKRGRIYENSRQFDSALACYSSASVLDSSYAELQFCMGHCFLQTGDTAEAARRYAVARNFDVLRFRSDDSINAIIKSIAAIPDRYGKVQLCDAKDSFDIASPCRIAGQKIFLEHVHMTFKGNYVLAASVYQKIQSVIPEWISAGKSHGETLFSEQECRVRMGYSEWEHFKIMEHILRTHYSRAPCARQLDIDMRCKTLADEMQSLAGQLTPDKLQEIISMYQKAVNARPNDPWLQWQYATFFSLALNDPRSAEDHLRILLNHSPNFAPAYSALSEAAAMQGDFAGTYAYAQKALEYNPYDVNALFNLGSALIGQGKYDEAILKLQLVVEREPYFENAYTNLATALSDAGRNNEAIEMSLKGLMILPQSEDLRLNLAAIFLEQKQSAEALTQMNTVLQNNPQSERARMLLQKIWGAPHQDSVSQ